MSRSLLSRVARFLTSSPRARKEIVPGIEPLEGRWVPANLTVNPLVASDYSTIGAAVTAARAGDTITVYPNEVNHRVVPYQEQVVLTKQLTLVAAPGHDTVSIAAPSGLSGAIVDIEAGSAAHPSVVSGFTIDGGGNAAGTIEAGVKIGAGFAGTISQDHIENLFHNTGIQSGLGIEVYGTATIDGDTIDSYLKGGILVDGAGASAKIEDNTITGVGSTAALAQNGIQISNGAQAYVVGNAITGNVYADTASSMFTATGILVLDDQSSVVLSNNYAAHNDVGALLEGSGTGSTPDTTNVSVSANDFSYNGITGGLIVENVSNTTVAGNVVDHNGADGIYVSDSTNVTIADNEASGNSKAGSFANQGTDVKGLGNGIVVTGGSDNTLVNNYTSQNAVNGIVLVGTTGNTLAYNGSTGNGGDGILLLSSDSNKVVDSVIFGNKGSGIKVDILSTGNIINNEVFNFPNFGFYGQGPGNDC